jgi:hypothetical protein
MAGLAAWDILLLHGLLKRISLQFRLKGGRLLGQIMQVLAERGAKLPI